MRKAENMTTVSMLDYITYVSQWPAIAYGCTALDLHPAVVALI
jgi:hypothetical protein